MSLVAVGDVVDQGHIASWKMQGKVVTNETDKCKKCDVDWPCPPILQARKVKP